MKELFNKLSNLFSFGKENRLANVETPDNSGPDDSNIDPMEVPLGQEAPDMSGPEMANEYTEEETSKLESEFKRKESTEMAKANTGLSKLEEELEQKKPELTDKEKAILDFEKPGGETILPKQAEYARVERDEASEGKEVSSEVDKQYYNYLRSSLKNFSPNDLKIANNILFGRAHQQNEMGTSPEDTMKYVKVLQESGDLNPLVKKAIELHKTGNHEDVESFEFWVDKNIRNRTQTQEAKEKMGADYLGIEKDTIRRETKSLIADFTVEEGQPVYVADAETQKEKPLSAEGRKKILAMAEGEESDKEWGPEKTPGKTPAEEVAELQRELRRAEEEKERLAGLSERGPK